jgi:hypothetical protein
MCFGTYARDEYGGVVVDVGDVHRDVREVEVGADAELRQFDIPSSVVLLRVLEGRDSHLRTHTARQAD